MKSRAELYLRNVIFGMIDSLVSTVGFLAGINAMGASRHFIVTTGVIYALVEGFSMAVGSFLSEESVEEFDAKKQINLTNSLIGGVVMFVSSVLSALIPLSPYIFISTSTALWVSVALSVLSLFVVGMVSAKLSKINILKRGISMAFVGGMAIVIGVLVGQFFKLG